MQKNIGLSGKTVLQWGIDIEDVFCNRKVYEIQGTPVTFDGR